MRKILTILLLAIVTGSCGSYVDHGESVKSDVMEFKYEENYNQFIYKSKINSTADNEVLYTTHFSVNLPKNIRNWQTSSNEFYFEYDSKEIIYINAGYKNKGDAGKWSESQPSNDEIYAKLSSYWGKRKYNEDALKGGNSGRVSKVYSDGKVSILLYNIKQENFEKYLGLVKSFKYLN